MTENLEPSKNVTNSTAGHEQQGLLAQRCGVDGRSEILVRPRAWARVTFLTVPRGNCAAERKKRREEGSGS